MLSVGYPKYGCEITKRASIYRLLHLDFCEKDILTPTQSGMEADRKNRVAGRSEGFHIAAWWVPSLSLSSISDDPIRQEIVGDLLVIWACGHRWLRGGCLQNGLVLQWIEENSAPWAVI